MQIAGNQIDDLKSERKDIMPPLPMAFRLVPILFYLALLFLAVVGSVSVWQMKVAGGRRDEAARRVATLKQDIAGQKASRAALEAKIREAANLEAWVLASMPLQPLVVAIARSVDPGSSIAELTVERDADTPSQLKLSLRLNTDSDQQLLKTLDVIRSMNYREVSPTQTSQGGELNYRASLLWQQGAGEQPPSPQERANQGARL